MNEQTTGIVLAIREYRETGALVHVLSEQYGKITFVAKGIQKLTSKNAAGCQLFHESIFQFDEHPGKELQTLKTAVLKDTHRMIQQDLLLTALASCCVEVLDKSENDEWQYPLLKNYFRLLEEGKEPLLTTSLFFSEVCTYLGITPFVDGCVICHTNPRITAVSIKDGGFICEDCAAKEMISSRSVQWLKSFRYICKAGLHELGVLEQYPVDQNMLTTLIEFFQYHTGIRLQSYRFLEEYLKAS